MASADIPIEGMKQYSYQYIINNTADYPDYVFLTSSEIWQFTMPTLVVNGTFGGGYKLDGFILHAIAREDLDQAVMDQLHDAKNENPDLTDYFEKAPIKTSEALLPVAVTIDDQIPVSNISVILSINDIGETDLNITKEKTIFGFENGTSDEAPYIEETESELVDQVGNFQMEAFQLS